MSLSVVEKACTFNGTSGTVVIESDIRGPSFAQAIEELQASDARNLALRHAIGHLPDPRINGNAVAYPINTEGYPLDQVPNDPETGKPRPPQHPLMQPACYRIDIPVTRKLI